MLPKHGKFQLHLFTFKLASTPESTPCLTNSADNMENFVFVCPAFSNIRKSCKLDAFHISLGRKIMWSSSNMLTERVARDKFSLFNQQNISPNN